MTASGLDNRARFPLELSPSSNNFDVIRLILSLLVVLSHSFPLSSGTEANEPLHRLSGKITFGELAVDGFFVLSGFLIAHSFLRSRSVGEFLLKRVLRIYPGFIVVGLLGVFVFGFAGVGFDRNYFAAFSVKNLVFSLATLHVPLLANVPHVPLGITINGSLWSIPFEFGCYLLVGMLGVATLLRRRWAVAILFLAAFSWYVWQEHYHVQYAATTWMGWIGGTAWSRLLTYFLAGTTFYAFRGVLPRNSLMVLGCAAALGASMVLSKGIHLVLPFCGTYLLFTAGLARRVKLPAFMRDMDLSYGIYLYAYPLQQLIMRGFGEPIPPLLLFALVLPPVTLAAMASWFWVERPFIRMKTKRPALRAAPPPRGRDESVCLAVPAMDVIK